jgi:hypothetical protein
MRIAQKSKKGLFRQYLNIIGPIYGKENSMSHISRRTFGKKALQYGGALSVLTVLNFPETTLAFLDKMEKTPFLKRDDVHHALKSLFMTYDSTTPYPHKFNETITKTQLGTLEFCIAKGIEKDYVDHYVATMDPLMQRIKKMVDKTGPEQGLIGMFEGTTCSYQLYERIDIKPGERSFPCPYKVMLERCKKYLPGQFTIAWEDVCNKWCVPTWSGFASKIGIKIKARPAETCSLKLV